MSVITELFEIIFYDDQGQRRTERVGLLRCAVGLARRLRKSGYLAVDVRDVYLGTHIDYDLEYSELLESVARAKRALLKPKITQEEFYAEDQPRRDVRDPR